ncbi:signal transduction histidine kinase [Streptomyces sp. BK208]|uniref:sensor histidine kinase n=1 Tax=Streptomyces sp. BK208 TaxID=2512150 RepID=UPI00105D8E83|nr:histidine kinase [Streptomyces sp. BK208]TDT38387.1 signal transduction histidine kinase [Streptomyces sp. BK208]
MAPRLPRPRRFDAYAASAGLLGGLLLWGIGLGVRPADEPVVLFDGRWPLLVPLVVMAGCELLRRAAPRTGLLVGTAALIADTLTRGSLVTVIMYTDLMYAAVLYGPPASARRIPWITGLLTVAGTVVPFALWRVPEALLIGVAVGIVSFAPASTGLIVRNHREAADAALLRAEQTALLAEMDRSQAVTAERSRMARELHDLVAGHLSAIAVHSTAALSLDDAATTRQALGVIRENSVAGLAEMRRLIGILRDEGGDTEPAAAPTLDGVGALVDGARANGLDVTLDAALDAGPGSAPRAGPGESLPAPVELAAYRIVQESLTNALKHASKGTVRVRLARYEGALRVEVTSPYGDRDTPRVPGSGAGLVGMRERAALLHGTFEAGPAPGPGPAGGTIWAVRATLPLTEGDLA